MSSLWTVTLPCWSLCVWEELSTGLLLTTTQKMAGETISLYTKQRRATSLTGLTECFYVLCICRHVTSRLHISHKKYWQKQEHLRVMFTGFWYNLSRPVLCNIWPEKWKSTPLFQNALEAEDNSFYVCVLSFKSSCTLEGVVQQSQTLYLICVHFVV